MNDCKHRAPDLGICCHAATDALPDLLPCRAGQVPAACPLATRPRVTLRIVEGVVHPARAG